MSEVKVTYVGGPTVLIEVGGWRILTDPTFDAAGRRYFFGWGSYSRKLTGPALAFSELGPIDAVLISHDQHGDNLDPSGRRRLPAMGQIITTSSGAGRLGMGAIGLAPWATTTLEATGKPTIEITATPCRHGPPGSRPIVGDVVGFMLRWVDQQHGALWISGDTVLYPGLAQVAERFEIGTAILHLGGVRFPWLTGPARYTMTAQDAVTLARQITPETIVPVHTEGWRHFAQPQAEARRVLQASAISRQVRWPTPGQPMSIDV